ncbi:MAG: hypothetical protein H7Z38_08265 [Rubrivivax sp.]|nr:hypothetical protein [Pyrinomonadaceae bacterium]
MLRRLTRTLALLAILILLTSAATLAQKKAAKSGASYGAASVARDREVAARFAPIFYQGLGDKWRSDLITNFNFDGDWRGDNNWNATDNKKNKLRAYVYYAVSETPTHLFIHYAVFHPRDYKGSDVKGKILSEAIREGVRRGGRYDPTGLSTEAVLAHENDMEGALVVVAKDGADLARANVVYVETLGHDRFQKYAALPDAPSGFKRVRMDGQRALLYVEPKGHGVSAYDADDKDVLKNRLLVYRFTGRAGEADGDELGEVGYDLQPLYTTLWPRARRGVNETYGAALDYGTRTVSVAGASGKAASRSAKLGSLGAAFRGVVGAPNMARPPWGWFDREERDERPGAWFFDPASTIKRHFKPGDDFSAAYTHAPFLGVFRR